MTIFRQPTVTRLALSHALKTRLTECRVVPETGRHENRNDGALLNLPDCHILKMDVLERHVILGLCRETRALKR